MPSKWHHAIWFDIILESKYFLTKKFLTKILLTKIVQGGHYYISKNNAK